MQQRGRHEVYTDFIDFVRSDGRAQRSAVNQRMFSVLLWCFVLPAALSFILVLLIRFGVVSARVRPAIEWLFLVFPVAYSTYFLATEFFRDIPHLLRHGGASANLRHCETEGVWRDRVVEGLKRSLGERPEDWEWITSSFRFDLRSLRFRNGSITVLAGAVFFLISQGLDFLSEEEVPLRMIRDPRLGWLEVAQTEPMQWAGLLVFLALFYLAGAQNINSVARYLDCAELALHDSRRRG